MPATYSINIGSITEASRKENVFQALSELKDNTQRLIKPRDVRDAFLTAYASSAFKITTPESIPTEYIGIDSSNPENRDIKMPILLGKRGFGNLDIITDSLLASSDADIFLYNTKSDSINQNSTKISILTGTLSSYQQKTPYIESLFITASNAIDLNLINPATAGAINIISESGRVSLNGIVFPTVQQTIASASNGRILKYSGTYPFGALRWEDPNVVLTSIGFPGATTSLFGNVLINGFPLEFIEDQEVPNPIGGIPFGLSFSENSYNGQNWPIVEVLRKLLYPYLPPVLSLSLTNLSTGTEYAEIGTTNSVSLDMTITTFARNSAERVIDWTLIGTTYSHTQDGGSSYNRINGPFSYVAIPGSTFSLNVLTSTFSTQPLTISTPILPLTYSLFVSNSGATAFDGNSGIPPDGFSHSAIASLNYLTPFVLKFDNSFALNSTSLETIITSTFSSKLIQPFPGIDSSIMIGATGYGYLHFCYPFSYGPVQKIKDPNGFILHDVSSVTASLLSSFTYSNTSIVPLTSTYYGPCRMYRLGLTSSYTGSGQFEFIF
jgi:hypothetical protein